MKLNPDCIRDVMLMLEEHLALKNAEENFLFEYMRLERLILLMNRFPYSGNEIAYSVLQLLERGYIVSSRDNPVDDKKRYLDIGNILYITPKGHDFISSVEKKSV